MTPVDPVMRARMRLSVNVNGVYLSLPDVPEGLRRFCRPLAFFNAGTPFELHFSGSCLLVRHHGHNLLLCSRHQLDNARRSPDEIIIVLDDKDDRRVGLNPSEVSQVVLDPASDQALVHLADIMIAEYAQNPTGRDLKPHFLPLDLMATPTLREVPADSIVAIFAIGYPTSDTDYDSRFDAEYNVVGVDIVSRWVKLYLKQTARNAWDKAGLVPLVPASGEDEVLSDPDGISGAPVFFIHRLAEHEANLGFAGVISHADKRGRVNLVEAAHIRQALEKHLNGN